MANSLLKLLILLCCCCEMLVAIINGWPLYMEVLPFIRVPIKYINTHVYRYYVAQISLGTPPQTFNVFVDTSSAESAIRSPLWKYTPGLPAYVSNKSSTYQKNGAPASVTRAYSSYLDYKFTPDILEFGKGFLSTDTLTIGRAPVKQQTFIEMSTLGSQMNGCAAFADGILGLAYPSASPSGATPFFQNMLQQGLISYPIFAITYDFSSDDFELTLGGMDSSKFKGLPTWTPVTEKRNWKFSVSGLVVRYSSSNITRVSCNGPTGCQMVIDSNTDGIYGSSEVLSRLGRVTGSPSLTQYQGFYCNQVSGLPDIGFTIGGNDFYMKPAQYMRLDTYDFCRRNPSSTSDIAWSYFFPYTPKDKFNGYSEVWILGTPFLRSVSTVFDFGNNRIGFTPN